MTASTIARLKITHDDVKPAVSRRVEVPFRLVQQCSEARLGDVPEDNGTKTLKYLYDLGDGWEHTIRIERLIDPEPGILYPRLIEAQGDGVSFGCLSEDVADLAQQWSPQSA